MVPVAASMSAAIRTIFTVVAAGMLLGILGTSLFAPRYLEWDNTTDGGDGMCLCQAKARQTADRVIYLQLYGASAGGAFGLISSLVWVLRRRRKAPANLPAAPTSTRATGV